MRTKMMKTVNSEVKKVLQRVKNAQTKFEGLLKNQDWIEDARKVAESRGKELKKILASDLGKVKTFVERERKELERFQKQIPGEVKRLKSFVETQRQDFERLLSNLKKANSGSSKSSGKKSKSGGTRKKSSKKSGSSNSSS